jgi:hypothetical protein
MNFQPIRQKDVNRLLTINQPLEREKLVHNLKSDIVIITRVKFECKGIESFRKKMLVFSAL